MSPTPACGPETPPLPAPFDEIAIGQVITLGEVRVDNRSLEAFIEAFAPGWPSERGAPDAMVRDVIHACCA